jgi:hypothetical protein
MPRYLLTPPPPSIPSPFLVSVLTSSKPFRAFRSQDELGHSLCPRVADLLRGGKVSSVTTTPHHTTPQPSATHTDQCPSVEVVCADHLMRFATRVARIQNPFLSKECGEGKGVSRSAWPAVYIFFREERKKGSLLFDILSKSTGCVCQTSSRFTNYRWQR